MNELLLSCSASLDQASAPACATGYGERIVTIVLAKTMLWTDVPTANEINIAHTAGTATVLKHVVNGHRVFLESQEIEVIHKQQVDKIYRIEGRVRRINEEIARMTEKLSRHSVLYVWYITDGNYCFGGYECSVDFTLRMFEGKGVPPFISFTLDFADLGIDYSDYDIDYQYIPQYVETGSVTSDSTLITVDSTIITSDQT